MRAVRWLIAWLPAADQCSLPRAAINATHHTSTTRFWSLYERRAAHACDKGYAVALLRAPARAHWSATCVNSREREVCVGGRAQNADAGAQEGAASADAGVGAGGKGAGPVAADGQLVTRRAVEI